MSSLDVRTNLKWWHTVNKIVEGFSNEERTVLRLRLNGFTIDECRQFLIERGYKSTTKARVRQVEDAVYRKIEQSLTPPVASPDRNTQHNGEKHG